MTDEVTDKLHAAEDQLLIKKAIIRTAIATEEIHTDYKDAPWQVEECDRGCACIVYQGIYQPFDEPQMPPIQYVADAETPAFAKWIALMHPGLAEPLAEVFCAAHTLIEQQPMLADRVDKVSPILTKLLKLAEVLTAGDDDD